MRTNTQNFSNVALTMMPNGPNDMEDPHCGDPPVYVQQLRAYLSIGTFIVSKRTEESASEPPFLGQILESSTISQVRVRVHPLLDAMTWSSHIARITTGEAAGVQEVVQSRGFRIISLRIGDEEERHNSTTDGKR
jgi:hypothetical protein